MPAIDYTISITQIITALCVMGAWLFAMGKIYQLLSSMQEAQREHARQLVHLWEFREDAKVRLVALETENGLRRQGNGH